MHWQVRRGGIDVYGIEDGYRFADPAVIFPTAPREVWSEHPDRLEGGRIRLTFSCYLLRTPTDLVMVDTGMGKRAQQPPEVLSGQMPATLAAVGARPEEITHVILTHLHRDHIGGLRMSTGDAYFPDARIHVAADELDHWMRLEGPSGDVVRGVMGGFVDAGRVTPVDDRPIVDGVSAFPTHGHTPGHVSVDIRSEGSRTVLTGDATLHPFQAGWPEVSTSFDSDPDEAADTRRRLFTELADDGSVRMAAGHYPFPGYGRVQSVDGRTVFVAEEIEVRS